MYLIFQFFSKNAEKLILWVYIWNLITYVLNYYYYYYIIRYVVTRLLSNILLFYFTVSLGGGKKMSIHLSISL